MFDRLLIANRGEIACRVIETARRMGITCIALYSAADRTSRHVALADEAYEIGPAPASESYLDISKILAVARDSGAQAVHPGYGFLSENPEFAEAVTEAGLIFVGPGAEAIRAMGLKDAAKRRMHEAGVPVVPGYQGENQNSGFLADQAQEIGYPVLIKAVAGGGGKGMRRVDTAKDFAEALQGAQAEAQKAFGNDRVLIEKYVTHPRHIEVQVFGDGKHAVHLFERDCSLQRRHQKVLEEAPAPGMSEAMRAAMGAAAVRAAEAIGYCGAGTVEFIADARDGLHEDRFWFMEMNTRLQVEHPVTELITGQDLVEWQLRVAAGEPLPKTQDELTLRGHAVEVRLYAEDPEQGFLPVTGTISHLKFPEGLRVDSGVVAGDQVSPHYDPMLAKLIAYDTSREAAFGKLQRGIEACELAGMRNNLDFLGRLCGQKDVRAGALDTGLIERHQVALTTGQRVTAAHLAQAAMVAAGLWTIGTGDRLAGFSLWQPLAFPVTLKRGEEMFACRILLASPTEGGGPHRVDTPLGAVDVQFRDGRAWLQGRRAPNHHRDAQGITLFDGGGLVFEVPDALDRAAAAGGGDGTIRAPMPGMVVRVSVAAGDVVETGSTLAVLEAMKMEHSLRAETAARVLEVLVSEGTQVEAGAVLLTLEQVE